MTRHRACLIPLLLAPVFALPACETLFEHFTVIPPDEPPRPPLVVDVAEKLASPPVGDPAIIPLLEKAPNASVALVIVQGKVAPHIHERSDETVYVLEGGGDLLLDQEWRPVKAGDLIHIPMGTPHAFVNRDPTRTVVMSTFAPPFVKGDRVMLEEETRGR